MIRLVSLAMDRKLTLPERVRLGAHLVMCRSCRRYRAHLWLIRHALTCPDLASDSAILPATTQRRIKAMLRAAGSEDR
jgi:hypothetical protein